MIKQIFDTIDQLNDEYVALWEQTCNMESPTSDKRGVDRVGDLYASMAEARGWLVERFLHPVAGNVVCITLNPQAQKAPLTLSGHMDTVHKVGSFGTPAVRIEGDRIYGPGVTDCKGGIVAAFLAMDAIDRCGFRDRPVRLLLQSDEEGGGVQSGDATIRYMCEKAADSVGFLNLEGTSDGSVCIARKGIATFTFTVHGVAAHSALCATTGASAIAEAAYKIIELEKLKDHKGITCSCTQITGGETHNTVAARCEFKANVRFATMAQLEEAKAYAERVANTSHVAGTSCEVILPRVRPALEFNERNSELFEALKRAWAKAGLEIPSPCFGTGGSDAANVSVYGIPALDNLGTMGKNIHTLDEYGVLSSLITSARRLASAAVLI